MPQVPYQGALKVSWDFYCVIPDKTVGQGNYSVLGQVVLVAEHLHGGVAQLGERLVCNQ